ncbi:hypothetical protein PTKIN_Ptkin02bG0098700 [Pterospermum kingtungense]
MFALDDGGEVDFDLGNYERFLDITFTCDENITRRKVYQVVPHIIDATRVDRTCNDDTNEWKGTSS